MEVKICANPGCDNEIPPHKKYCSNKCKYYVYHAKRRRVILPRRCKNIDCRKMFKPANANQIFCSEECCNDFHRTKRRRYSSKNLSSEYIPMAFRCRYCGRWNWTENPNEEPKRKYCDDKCRITAWTKKRTPKHRRLAYKRKAKQVESLSRLDKRRPCLGWNNTGQRSPEYPGYLRYGYYPYYQCCETCRKYFLRNMESRCDGDWIYMDAI